MINLSKKICIDIRPLETSNKYRGFGYYIYNLTKEIILADSTHQYVFLVYSDDNSLIQLIKKHSNCSYVKINKPKVRPRFWWLIDQIVVPKIMKQIKPDVFVALDMGLPLLLTFQKKIKTINAMHDLILLIMAKEYNFPIDKTLEFKSRFWATQRANKVLTVSNYSKNDLVKYLGIPEGKIAVVHGAIDESFKQISVSQQDQIRLKFTQGKKYLVVLGDYFGIDPRKNYKFIVDGFGELRKNLEFADYNLVFVGKSGGTGNDYEKILTQAKRLDIQNKVIFTDFVSQETLIQLLSAAEILLYPTKYEGFGLPPLQAMACETPVLTSNNSSLPEVCGDAAVLLNNTEDMAEFINSIEKLTFNREKYIKLGIQNVKRFSWRQSAQDFVSVISEISK